MLKSIVIFLGCMTLISYGTLSERAYTDSAKNAWLKLVGKKQSKVLEFAFVQNNPDLPNVLIYGDSISIGYTEPLKLKLAGKANVYRIFCNGGDSESFIPKMTKMHDVMQNIELSDHWSFDWDVIHFNVGLHDLKYLVNGKHDKNKGKQVSSIDSYKKNLRGIVLYIKKHFPKTKLIFATTTPVPDGEKGRVAGDAAKFNTAALKVMSDFPEVKINDLFAFTKPKQSKWWIKSGNVHFNSHGKQAQGEQIAGVILEGLNKK